MNYNKVILVGRLVREPETVMLPSGTQVANLVLAYNRNYKDQSGQWKEESHFFEIKVFGWLVEKVIPNLGKGDLVLIEGRLQQDKWLDKQSGEPRSKVRIVASEIKLLSRAGTRSIGQPAETTGEELPSFDTEDLLPPPSGKNEVKEPEEELDDLDKILFGEEENEKPEGGKNKKTDEEDDLDILL